MRAPIVRRGWDLGQRPERKGMRGSRPPRGRSGGVGGGQERSDFDGGQRGSQIWGVRCRAVDGGKYR